MKRIISVFLSLVLLISTVSFTLTAYAQEDDILQVAVGSDLHYNIPRDKIEGDIDDELFYYANRRAAMEDESGFIIDEFLKQCAEDDNIQYVLICGDLADDGRTVIQSHYDVAEKLRKFEQETNKPVYITNGNHDTSAAADETTNEKFREIYAEFGYDEALAVDEGTLSYTVNLGNKYRLIVCDSCDPSVSTEDGLTSDRVDWICEQAKVAQQDGRYPILMMHHNLLEHMPVQRILSHDFIVRNHSLNAERIANAGIKTVFTGHEHGSDVTSFTSSIGNTVYDFSTTSLTMYPLSYRFVKFEDNEISYESRSIDKIDYQNLYSVVDGYTDEHKEFMESDFTEYSKQFYKKSVQYRLWLGLTPEKLGIDEDAFYADIVYTAVNGLVDYLERPLYGDDSVQERARDYNIDIPDSDYENGWDLATEIVGYHYSGNEPFDLESTEITILFRVVDFILLDVLSTVNDKCFLSAANTILSNLGTESICKDFTKLCAKTFGPVTAGEYFLLAVASPILYGLAYDGDGVDDNNGTIPGYAVTGNNIDSIKQNTVNFFSKLSLYFKFFISYILKIFRIG